MSNNADEMYVPYKDGKGEWWFDDNKQLAHGPFITEEACVNHAEKLREKDEQ